MKSSTDLAVVSDPRMQPRFKHDCASCIYLATVHCQDGPVDWYVHHNDSARGDSMIGRYGDEPSENITPHWTEPKAIYWDGKVNAHADSSLIAWALRTLYSAGQLPKE